MKKITDKNNYQLIYPFKNRVTSMIPDKNDMNFFSAINNSDIETLRKDERFNELVTSLIKLHEKENKNITREEAEILAIDILGPPKVSSKTESEKDTIDKLIELSKEVVDEYIQKHR